MQNSFINSTEEVDSKINLTEQLFKYLRNWKWFVLSVLIAVSIAYIYLRYQMPQYGLTTTILIKDDKKGTATELDAFSDLGILGVKKSNLENEIEMFRSRILSQNTVKELKFNVSYYAEGRILTPELYTESPIELVFENDKSIENKWGLFYFKFLKDNSFELQYNEQSTGKVHTFGEVIPTSLGNIVINRNKKATINTNTIIIKITPLMTAAISYKNMLTVAPVGEKTSIIQLSVVDPLPSKGMDYLNTLVMKFNEDALNDKNLVAKNTQDFIDERLSIITGELDTVERSAERFKKENRLTDLVTDAGLNLTTSSEYEKALANNGKELMVVEFMLNSIKNSGIDQTIPENIIPTENASTSLINQYNVMVLERNRLLKSTSANHPNVLNYNQQITALKGTIQQSLRNVQSSLTIAKKQLLQQESKFNSKVSQVPTLDRKYRNIERQQNIKEALYLYLRQKQEETAITMAVTSPKAKVIDSAYSIGVVSPNTRNIYLIALLLGLLIPFSVIYLIQLLDTKIHSRHDLEKYLKLPFLGDIPLSETSDEIMTSESRSSTA